MNHTHEPMQEGMGLRFLFHGMEIENRERSAVSAERINVPFQTTCHFENS